MVKTCYHVASSDFSAQIFTFSTLKHISTHGGFAQQSPSSILLQSESLGVLMFKNFLVVNVCFFFPFVVVHGIFLRANDVLVTLGSQMIC